jgi:hypothetical protein
MTGAPASTHPQPLPSREGSVRGPPFLLEDIRRALVAGEEADAILGGDERLQRMDAREQADEIVLSAKREHRVDQVVPDARLALLDLETVGEEDKNFAGSIPHLWSPLQKLLFP